MWCGGNIYPPPCVLAQKGKGDKVYVFTSMDAGQSTIAKYKVECDKLGREGFFFVHSPPRSQGLNSLCFKGASHNQCLNGVEHVYIPQLISLKFLYISIPHHPRPTVIRHCRVCFLS